MLRDVAPEQEERRARIEPPELPQDRWRRLGVGAVIERERDDALARARADDAPKESAP
jgi:hypothetical protein